MSNDDLSIRQNLTVQNYTRNVLGYARFQEMQIKVHAKKYSKLNDIGYNNHLHIWLSKKQKKNLKNI